METRGSFTVADRLLLREREVGFGGGALAQARRQPVTFTMEPQFRGLVGT